LTIADKKFALENNLNVKNQVKSMANISGTFDKD
jgi:hypothetical protein